jgi:hypothetical protein
VSKIYHAYCSRPGRISSARVRLYDVDKIEILRETSGEKATASVNKTENFTVPEMVYSSTRLLVIKHKLYVVIKRCILPVSFIKYAHYNFTFYFMWV